MSRLDGAGGRIMSQMTCSNSPFADKDVFLKLNQRKFSLEAVTHRKHRDLIKGARMQL